MTGGSGSGSGSGSGMGLNDKEKRIVDEALSKMTGGKLRIEDVDKMAMEDAEFIDELQKHVMHAILDNCKRRVIMAMAISPGDVKGKPDESTMMLQLVMYMNTFIEGLLRRWNYIITRKLGDSRIEDFEQFMKDIQGDWRNKG